MAVDKPTPGNLIQTVAELVDSVNGGGGGTDLSNYSGDTIRLTATSADVGMEIRTTPEFSALTISTQGDSSALTVFAGGTGSILDIIGDGAVGITSISSINMAANGVSGHIQAVAKDHILFGVNEASSLELLGNGNITIDGGELHLTGGYITIHTANDNLEVLATGDGHSAAYGASGTGGQSYLSSDGLNGIVNISAVGVSGIVNITSDTTASLTSNNGNVNVATGVGGTAFLVGGSVNIVAVVDANIQTNPSGALGFYGATAVTKPSGLTAGASLESLGLATNTIADEASVTVVSIAFDGVVLSNGQANLTPSGPVPAGWSLNGDFYVAPRGFYSIQGILQADNNEVNLEIDGYMSLGAYQVPFGSFHTNHTTQFTLQAMLDTNGNAIHGAGIVINNYGAQSHTFHVDLKVWRISNTTI